MAGTWGNARPVPRRFDVVADFNPDTGRTEIMPRPQGLGVSATDGWLSLLAGVCVVFYRRSGHLWLRVGERTFDVDRDPKVEWRREGRMSILSVSADNAEVVLRYQAGPRSGPPVSDDPTPFIDHEDWDLGLFVSNVIFDEERAEIVRHGPG